MGVSEKRQNFHFGVEYPFKSLWIWKCIPMHNRLIFTKRFSPAWTSLTIYTQIDAHKQTHSAILHLFTTLPYILLLFYL